jgi:hypothetical protein
MAGDDEDADNDSKKESVRLSAETVEMCQALADLKIFASSKTAVYRYFIQEGVNRAVADEVIEKYQRARTVVRTLKRKAK